MTVPTILAFAAIAMTSNPAPSTQRQMLTLDDGSGLRYALAVPDGYDGSRAVPLVLALHFGWGEALPPNYSAIFLEILVEPALRDLGAVVVAPLCPARSWVDPASEGAVMALLDHIRNEFRIDEERIVITGFSLGGMGTWYLASRHPELFSAAIPMASIPMIAATPNGGAASVQRYREPGDVDWPAGLVDLPLYIVHSRDDELIPAGPVESATAELRGLGADVELRLIGAGLGHHETPRYVPYLAEAVPWLRRVWNGDR